MKSPEEQDEKQFAPLINNLRSLKKINAPISFEEDLQKQIKHVLSKEKKSIFNKYIRRNSFFQSTIIISLLGFTLILVVFIFVLFFLLKSGTQKPKTPATQQIEKSTQQVDSTARKM